MNSLIRTSLTIAIFISLVQAIERCNKDCEKYGEDLICANDGVTWFNEQCMRACSTTEKVKIAHKGLCKEYRELYPVVGGKGDKKILCKDCEKPGLDLTCANDGLTWYNEHCMRACSSVKNVRIMHKGLCKDFNELYPNAGVDPFQNIGDKPLCNKNCERPGQDITCANDGLTWYNEDCMRACSSRENVKVEHKGPCKGFQEHELYVYLTANKAGKGSNKIRPPPCARKCKMYGHLQVCGTDGRTWMNEQCMRECSPAKNVEVFHKGPCRDIYS